MEAVPKINLCNLPFAEFFTPRLREPGKILNMTKSKDKEKETNSTATYGMRNSPRVSPKRPSVGIVGRQIKRFVPKSADEPSVQMHEIK